MTPFRNVMLVALVWFASAGAACSQKAADEARDATREGAAAVVGEVKGAGEDIANTTADKTREIAGQTADKAREIVGDFATTTGEVISDTWITAKVKAKFLDEAQLNGSRVDVDTDDHVVTLRGTVASVDAKNRAAAIASGTEGVTRVVNYLVVT